MQIVSVWRVFLERGCRRAGPYIELSCISNMGTRPKDCSHDMTRAFPLSPIIRLLALVLAEVISGITEASITRNLSTPRTRNCGSSTDARRFPFGRCRRNGRRYRRWHARNPIGRPGCRRLRREPFRCPTSHETISVGRCRAGSGDLQRWSCGRFPRQSSSARCAAGRTDRSIGWRDVRAIARDTARPTP